MKILYFAPLAYDGLKQRPQQIAEELSLTHEIWYIEPTISFASSFFKNGLDCKKRQYDVSSNLHVLRLNGRFALPIRYQIYDKFMINTLYERLQLKKMYENMDAIWIGYEVCKRLVPDSFAGLLIYDKMDDNILLSTQKTVKRFIGKMEKELVKKADIIFVTAHKFYNQISKEREHVYIVPNGIGFDKCQPGGNKIPPKIHKVLGYIGRIGHWVDAEAIKRIALVNKNCEIALVGPNDQEIIKLPNVKYYGTVPKEDIPLWIDYMDTCLYPFKQTELLDTIDPVKIYEYLSRNKPVIAVDSYEMNKYHGLINCYHDYTELEELSQKNLKPPFSNHIEINDFLKKNSWKSRAETINRILLIAEEKQQ